MKLNCSIFDIQHPVFIISFLSFPNKIIVLHNPMSRLDKYRKLPVFRKSEELVELAEAIAGSLKDSVKTEFLAAEIMTNAYIIQAKIAGAEGGSLYSLRMQSAVLIKLAAQDILNSVSS